MFDEQAALVLCWAVLVQAALQVVAQRMIETESMRGALEQTLGRTRHLNRDVQRCWSIKRCTRQRERRDGKKESP